MTDAYRYAGPLGRSTTAFSGAMRPALCGSLTFHSKGYLVSVCPSIGAPPQARVIDPDTLEVLATYDMPTAPDPPGTRAYQNFAGGGYFFLDGKNRIWSATKTSHLFVLQVSPDGRSITKVGDYDLTATLQDDERITSALPDFKGRIWFVSKKNGKVGILNPRTRAIRVKRLGEDVQNSFAVDRNAVYIVSSARMYRFSARRGWPRIDWRRRYRNSGIAKPGQADAGSGTTPTLMHGGYVAITDNDDPMNVVVYRKRTGRVTCRVPVFEPGGSATENSLMASRRSLFVENNYGYQDPFGPSSGALTTPGFARVDVNDKGCRVRWTNRTERAPSVVPKLSTAGRPHLHLHARPRPAPARPALLLDRDRRPHRRHGVQGLRRQRPRLQQQLRRHRDRSRRHRLPRRHRRDRRPALNLHGFRPSPPHRLGTLAVVGAALICVIEDEAVIAQAVAARLKAEGFAVEVAGDGETGVELCDRTRPDLVVLDVMLPGLDGLEVCRRIQRDRPVPVLMLTARGEEADVLVGLGVGADDYMTKPFSPRELVARIKALLRRVERRPAPAGEALQLGALKLDPLARRVTVGDEPVHLTPTEFDLLRVLAARPGAVHTREQLLAEVWGWRDGSGQRTVDSHVRGLRRKLGADLVRTVHGIGYALEP